MINWNLSIFGLGKLTVREKKIQVIFGPFNW